MSVVHRLHNLVSSTHRNTWRLHISGLSLKKQDKSEPLQFWASCYYKFQLFNFNLVLLTVGFESLYGNKHHTLGLKRIISMCSQITRLTGWEKQFNVTFLSKLQIKKYLPYFLPSKLFFFIMTAVCVRVSKYYLFNTLCKIESGGGIN